MDKFEKEFSLIAMDSGQWLEHAQSMRVGANAILDRLQPMVNDHKPRGEVRVEMLGYVRTYMLLMGFAIENLLKAIAVGRGLLNQTNNKLKFDALLSRQKGGHSLIGLAQDLELELTQKEQQYLERLEEYIYWGGRYPIPLTLGTYKDCQNDRRLTFKTNDPEIGSALFDKLSKSITKT